jgi:2-polyprenyl-3-methyl-5-hydroxy-6-metoxy-1,4-benzoquinol methylase
MNLQPGSFGEYGEVELTQSKYITKERHDLLSLIPVGYNCSSILEIGCADGNNLKFFSGCLNVPIDNCLGIDICKSSESKYELFPFQHISVEDFFKKNKNKFDLIIFSDVLEHCFNPWKILASTRKILNYGGLILISVPNFQNLNYLNAINSGEFFYEETGLFDQTHIRFFSSNSIKKYLQFLGYKVINSGFRADASLSQLKADLIKHLESSNSSSVSINNLVIHISKFNIEEYFGQQVVICAGHA